MFKHTFVKSLTLALSAVGLASALPFSFIYEGNSFGTMDLTVAGANRIQVQFTAAGSVPGYTNYQITGFAFDLAASLNPALVGIADPADNFSALDNDTWDAAKMTALNAIPTSTNTGIQKDIWDIGVSTMDKNGKVQTFNPSPTGILPGTSDIFYITGFSGLVNDASIASNVLLSGIRIQSIEGAGVPGSLFLTSSPFVATPSTPEPSTLALLGLGLAGIGFAARRKSK